tara:strand:- start:520 stop:726 length:207 start_codon:yes stop_codon:yes gene_type:complete
MKKVEKFTDKPDRFKVRRPKEGDVGHNGDLSIISFSLQRKKMNYKYKDFMQTSSVSRFTVYGARVKDV